MIREVDSLKWKGELLVLARPGSGRATSRLVATSASARVDSAGTPVMKSLSSVSTLICVTYVRINTWRSGCVFNTYKGSGCVLNTYKEVGMSSQYTVKWVCSSGYYRYCKLNVHTRDHLVEVFLTWVPPHTLRTDTQLLQLMTTSVHPLQDNHSSLRRRGFGLPREGTRYEYLVNSATNMLG